MTMLADANLYIDGVIRPSANGNTFDVINPWTAKPCGKAADATEADVEEAYADTSAEYFWLVTDADDAYDELGLGPHDFDVVFAYPWPGMLKSWGCEVLGFFRVLLR